MQHSAGALIVFLYALYGAYIESLFMLIGDKGGHRSADFLLFVIVFLLFCLSDLGKLLILKIVKNKLNLLIVLFILYLLLKVLFTDSETQSYYLGILFSEIGVNFIVGFIAFSMLESRMPIISKIIVRRPSAEKVMILAVVSALIFIGSMIYFLTQFLGTSLLGIIQLRVLTNDYYQDFGDYITIAYCCSAALGISYFYLKDYSDSRYAMLALALIAEAAIAFVCLQVVNSNKSVMVIMLVLVSTIYFCKPKNWLFWHGRIKRKVFLLIPIILMGGLLSYQFLQAIDVSQFRIFDYGESDSLLANSSLLVRWQMVQDNFMDQFLSAPLFGDLSITNYMHSSLLSVQTHLGIIGSLFLWSFIVLQLHRIFRSRVSETLKAISIPILFTSIVSSFFSWGPLWFLIGALYAHTAQSPMQLHELHDQSLRHNSQSSRFVGQQLDGQVKC